MAASRSARVQEGPDPTDEALMEQVAQGSKQAFSTLVERYRRRIFLVAYHILGTAPEADDVTQDTFLNVFRKAHTFRQEGRFHGWVHKICVNLAIRSRQRGSARRADLRPDLDSAEAPGPVEMVPEHMEDPARAVERREMVTAVKDALDRLEPAQRTVFVLRVFHDLSYKEIADAMDCSIGTVQSRLGRAREALRGFVHHARDDKGGV